MVLPLRAAKAAPKRRREDAQEKEEKGTWTRGGEVGKGTAWRVGRKEGSGSKK